MSNQKRLGRSESLLKLAIQQKEAKLWYEEANCHVKGENLFKALQAYNKVNSLFSTILLLHFGQQLINLIFSFCIITAFHCGIRYMIQLSKFQLHVGTTYLNIVVCMNINLKSYKLYLLNSKRWCCSLIYIVESISCMSSYSLKK